MRAPQFKYECQQAAFRLVLMRDLRKRGVCIPADVRYDTDALIGLHGEVTSAHISHAEMQRDRNIASRKAF